MKLREATVQDAEAVVHLITGMLQEMASHGGHALGEEACVRGQLRARFRDSFEKGDHVYFVVLAEGRGKPVGVVEASVVSPHGLFRPKRVVHIHALYVQPRYRGEGIGRGLLTEALTWGTERGCKEAALSVLAANPARELYESLGFKVFELEMWLDL